MKIYIVVLSTLLLSWPSLAGNSKSQKAEDCPLLSSANLHDDTKATPVPIQDQDEQTTTPTRSTGSQGVN